MKIAVFYNRMANEGILSAYLAYTKYVSQIDSAGTANSVEMHDVTGMDGTALDADIYAMVATSYHRIFNFTTTATAVYGQVSAAQITDLTAKLLTSASDTLSDDAVITILPAQYPGSLIFTRNQAQNVWDFLFCYGSNPVYLTPAGATNRSKSSAIATSGAATTITSTNLALTVNALAGMWIYLISGTGRGQYRKIASNTATQITVTSAWGANPASATMFIVSNNPPRPTPTVLQFIGGNGSEYDNGTATSGAATSITDTGKSWPLTLAGKYVYIYDGTGIGQYKVIISNTSNALTVSAWTTNPDNTSKYIIVNRLDEVFLYEYFQRWLWVYTNDPTNSTCLIYLNKLFNKDLRINSTDPVFPSAQDGSFINDIVLPQGKAIYDAVITTHVSVNPIPKFVVKTTGTLVQGKTYYMYDWKTADDFVNVGGTNADNTSFVAKGTTPTTWAAGSIVIQLD